MGAITNLKVRFIANETAGIRLTETCVGVKIEGSIVE